MQDNSTICAICTPAGVGGIAVIRISGKDAFAIVDAVFKPYGKSSAPLSNTASHRLRYGSITDKNGEIVDEVLCSVFRSPNSFTGEDTIEISCHGSLYIQKQIVHLLLNHGCRMAGHGEFTQRAYLNGKMDLSQAEAVADLIASSSAKAHNVAMKQLKGHFSSELVSLRASLLHFVSLIELELDFSEEDVEFADRKELVDLLQTIESRVTKLINSFKAGNAIKNGIPTAIVGETNVGKSTLLNLLLGENRAIVSGIHGTTRDTIEDLLSLGGYMFRLIDTAGIRETTDEIESLGIKRTFEMIERSEIVVLIIDASRDEKEIISFIDSYKSSFDGKQVVLLFNKSDLVDDTKKDCLLNREYSFSAYPLSLSAKYGKGKEELEKRLIQIAEELAGEDNDVIVTNARHYDALCTALDGIKRVNEGLNNNLSGDLLSRDIHDVLDALASITGGEITTDEVLGNIFKHFCIGK